MIFVLRRRIISKYLPFVSTKHHQATNASTNNHATINSINLHAVHSHPNRLPYYSRRQHHSHPKTCCPLHVQVPQSQIQTEHSQSTRKQLTPSTLILEQEESIFSPSPLNLRPHRRLLSMIPMLAILFGWMIGLFCIFIQKAGNPRCERTILSHQRIQKLHRFHGAIGDLKGLSTEDGTVRIGFSAKVTPHGDIVRSNETATPEALVYDKLWVRHWDEWITSNKNSIFSGTLTLKDGKYSIDDSPKNMLNSTEDIHNLESPIPPFGGSDDYSMSPTHLAFIAKDPHLNPATNTASHVYVVSFNDSKYLEQINKGPGASSSPVWSPDGKYLAYLEMRVRGYEADRISLENGVDCRSSSCRI